MLERAIGSPRKRRSEVCRGETVLTSFGARPVAWRSQNWERAKREGQTMMDDPVELDEHRGMAAQKPTEIPPAPRRGPGRSGSPATRAGRIRAPCRRGAFDDLARGGRKGAISDPTFRCDPRGTGSAAPRAGSASARRSRPIVRTVNVIGGTIRRVISETRNERCAIPY